jgi:hypothetical protein
MSLMPHPYIFLSSDTAMHLFSKEKKGRELGKRGSTIKWFVWIIKVVIFWIVHEHKM